MFYGVPSRQLRLLLIARNIWEGISVNFSRSVTCFLFLYTQGDSPEIDAVGNKGKKLSPFESEFLLMCCRRRWRKLVSVQRNAEVFAAAQGEMPIKGWGGSFFQPLRKGAFVFCGERGNYFATLTRMPLALGRWDRASHAVITSAKSSHRQHEGLLVHSSQWKSYGYYWRFFATVFIRQWYFLLSIRFKFGWILLINFNWNYSILDDECTQCHI